MRFIAHAGQDDHEQTLERMIDLPTYIYLLIALMIVIVGALATVSVALSKENKEGNPDYDAKRRKNWNRLTLYYVAATAISILLFVMYLLFR